MQAEASAPGSGVSGEGSLHPTEAWPDAKSLLGEKMASAPLSQPLPLSTKQSGMQPEVGLVVGAGCWPLPLFLSQSYPHGLKNWSRGGGMGG